MPRMAQFFLKKYAVLCHRLDCKNELFKTMAAGRLVG